MFIITKEFHFSASHILKGLPKGHPCGRLHGHNYIVQVELKSLQVDSVGFVQDYGELAPIKEWIDSNWDHRHLNEVMETENYEKINPTAENMAKYLFDKFRNQYPKMSAITIKETPKTAATYHQ